MDQRVLHTNDPRMKKILDIVDSVANSRATILLLGESGTGKELLARRIHARSSRAQYAFQALNCAAVPDGLLESELFGYEKGAFTGAENRRIGRFELAHGSSLLLDEISELPLVLQAKLLRVIQEGEVERLGGRGPVRVNVRLIASSNRSLVKMVREGLFREDLFYRLNVVTLEIPPLRERPRDIPLLAQLFIDQITAENDLPAKRLSGEALSRIQDWRWPGNVRELRNVMERAVLLSRTEMIEAMDLPTLVVDPVDPGGVGGGLSRGQPQPSGRVPSLTPGMTVSELEEELIRRTLEHTGQNRTQAAQLLGISIRTLRNKLNGYKNRGVKNEQSL